MTDDPEAVLVAGGWESDLEPVPGTLPVPKWSEEPPQEDEGERPPSRHALRVRKYRRKIARSMEAWRAGRCEQCGGKDYKRELAHLTATGLKGEGRGMERRYYDIRTNPDCYARLCIPCHRRYDRLGGGRLVRIPLSFVDDPPPWSQS